MKNLLVALGIAALSTGAMAQNVGSNVVYNADNGHYYQRFMNNNLVSWDEAKAYAESDLPPKKRTTELSMIPE